MKPYFAKWLPVEREIKEGDAYKVNHSGEIKIAPGNKSDYMYEYVQKVKLFLCSRDIKLGDVAYNDEFCPYPNGQLLETNSLVMDHGMMTPDSFKVVGEISSETTWVKEGDTFEENEINIISIRQWTGEDFQSETVQIKCPTCKTFH